MIHIYDVIMNGVTGCNNLQLFHLGKITRNYCIPVTCDHVILVIILLNIKVKGI